MRTHGHVTPGLMALSGPDTILCTFVFANFFKRMLNE